MSGGRPYVHINCASTLDGKIALPDGGRLRISTPWDKARVHRLRATLGAVLVGAGTVIADDPKLTVDPEMAEPPESMVKIVLDGAGRIPPSARFLGTEGRSVVVTTEACPPGWRGSFERLEEEGRIELLVLKRGPDIDPLECFMALDRLGVRGILVEGGSDTIARIVASGEFDLLTIFYGPLLMGGHGPTIAGGPGIGGGPLALRLSAIQRPVGGGILAEYTPVRDKGP
jgi:riboflavin-specific deaminase-like protein